MKKRKRAVIAGGAGFIGANLCEILSEDGWHIAVIDDLSTGINRDEVRSMCDVFLEKDITQLDKHEARFIFQGADVVYNLVGRTWHGKSMTDPSGDARANIVAPLAVLEWAWIFGNHVVYTGTRGQYGRAAALPVREDAAKHPIDINGISKQAAEDAHLLFARHHDVRVTCLRLPNIFGPRHQTETPDGVVNWFITQAIKGEPLKVYGGMRDILCVCEVSSALVRCAERPECYGRAFNVGGRGMRLIEYARLVAAAAPTEVIETHPPSGCLEVGDFLCDASAFRQACGWELSSADVKDLVADTVKWYKEKNND